MGYVIFPQAFRNVLPALGNEFIALLKDSSLLSVIAIAELTRVGKQIYSTTFNAWTPLLGVALFLPDDDPSLEQTRELRPEEDWWP